MNERGRHATARSTPHLRRALPARRPLMAVCYLLLTACCLLLTPSLSAQEPLQPPPVTPSAEDGFEIYLLRCANCHGETGMGDGELAANLPNPVPALGSFEYADAAIPAAMYNIISNGNIANGMPLFGEGSSNPLSVQERWDVIAAVYNLSRSPDFIASGEALADADARAFLEPIDWINVNDSSVVQRLRDNGYPVNDAIALAAFGRTFSYEPFDLAALNAPLAVASITGLVSNGTTGRPVTDLDLELRAFNASFEIVDNQFVQPDESGNYRFDLTNVEQDWAYIVFADYGGINYSTDVVNFSPSTPDQELELLIFETTTDSADITIERLNTILEFDAENILVSQFYAFSNDSNAVYVGDTGAANSAVLSVALPAGAEDVAFQRSLGTDFVPAPEVEQVGAGWADTLPIRPGIETAGLLVNYRLPYNAGMTLAHPLDYPVRSSTLILPQNGVSVSQADWIPEGEQLIGDTTYQTFTSLIEETLTIELDGQPNFALVEGNRVAVRNQQAELLVGSGALLLSFALAGLLVQRWRRPLALDKAALLEQIAALDDAYVADEIGRNAYLRRRQQLKNQLRRIWR